MPLASRGAHDQMAGVGGCDSAARRPRCLREGYLSDASSRRRV